MQVNSPYFNEDHELFRQSVRQFVDKEIRPNTKAWEDEQRIPKAFWKKMGDMGFLGINHEEKYGGTNNDFFHTVVLLEELARAGMGGLSAAQGVHQYMSTAHISKVGSAYLKEKYITGAVEGTLWGALGITEPGAGSDVANIKTTAKKEGDHYIINGQKTFITNGVYGDFVTLACKTDTNAGVGGISLIVVDYGTPGFTTNKLEKIGWRSSDTGELFFDNVKVPAKNLIGEEGQGFYYIMESFQLERLVSGIAAISGAEYGLEITLKYIHEREAFGRPIGKFQVIRHRLVDLATEIEAAKQLTYYASWLYDQGKFAVKECSMVKLLTTEIAKKAADICLQCFGGYGYMEEYEIARMYRDARVGTIVGGTSEIMREILAKLVVDNVSYQSAYKQNGESKPKKEQKIEKEQIIEKQLTENKQTNMEQTPETAKQIVESLHLRFRPEKAEGIETVFHFDISGENGGQWTIAIADSTISVVEGHNGEANCVMSTEDATYEDTELGRSNPQMAVMMGKIKITNLGEMMKFVGLFRRLF